MFISGKGGYEMDIFDLLDEGGIEYWTSGKNVMRGHCNIQCPFCNDGGHHLGINLKTLRVRCWRCGNHFITTLVRHIKGCSPREAYQIAETLKAGGEDIYIPPPDEIKKSEGYKTTMPAGSSRHFPQLHLDYLKGRGFRPARLIRKYKLESVYTVGRYKFRIIIPVFLNRKLVSFTSRDVTGEQEPKYLNPKEHEVLLSPKQAVYNYDTIIEGGDVIVVEGPIDVWKMGESCVSLQGIEFTTGQVKLLQKKKINRLLIMFDRGYKESKSAEKLAREMAPVVKEVEIVSLSGVSDPGKLTIEEARKIKQALLIQEY